MNYLLIYKNKYVIVNNSSDIFNIINHKINIFEWFTIIKSNKFLFNRDKYYLDFRYLNNGDMYVNKVKNNMSAGNCKFIIESNTLTLDILEDVLNKCGLFCVDNVLL